MISHKQYSSQTAVSTRLWFAWNPGCFFCEDLMCTEIPDLYIISNLLRVNFAEDALISKTSVRLRQHSHIGMRGKGAASFDILDLILSSPACWRTSDCLTRRSWFKKIKRWQELSFPWWQKSNLHHIVLQCAWKLQAQVPIISLQGYNFLKGTMMAPSLRGELWTFWKVNKTAVLWDYYRLWLTIVKKKNLYQPFLNGLWQLLIFVWSRNFCMEVNKQDLLLKEKTSDPLGII